MATTPKAAVPMRSRQRVPPREIFLNGLVHRPLHLRDDRSNDLGIRVQVPELAGITATAGEGNRTDFNATELLHQQLPAPRAVPSPVHEYKGEP